MGIVFCCRSFCRCLMAGVQVESGRSNTKDRDDDDLMSGSLIVRAFQAVAVARCPIVTCYTCTAQWADGAAEASHSSCLVAHTALFVCQALDERCCAVDVRPGRNFPIGAVSIAAVSELAVEKSRLELDDALLALESRSA